MSGTIEWTIDVGDVVRLAHGEPEMTVIDIQHDDITYVYCQWYNDGDLCGASFPARALVLCEVFQLNDDGTIERVID
jgi:uncharacterized protein YodC (DUF2158 family)